MSIYTKIDRAFIKNLLATYGLEQENFTFFPQKLGITNTNYKICTPTQTLIVKIFNDKSLDHLLQEIPILEFLHQFHFPLPFPLSFAPQQYVFQISGHIGLLFPFIHGKAPQINSETCNKIGAILGRLHLLSQHLPQTSLMQIRPYVQVGFNLERIHNFVLSSHCPLDFSSSYQELIEPYAPPLSPSLHFPEGLIHGDLYYDNTLFLSLADTANVSTMTEMVQVIDFEQSGMGEFILDLGISISGTCLINGKVHRPFVQNFIQGYELHRPLSPLERKYLDFYIILGLLSIALWRIKRFTLGSLDPAKALSYRELLLRAQNFSQESQRG